MPTAPYETIEGALNLARTRLNDAIQSIGGEILTDDAPFALTTINGAYRKLQGVLLAMGYPRLENESFALALSAVSPTDPMTRTTLSWGGYFNGTTLYTAANQVLPQDFMYPIKLWERPSGTGQLFYEMEEKRAGIPLASKRQRNVWWEWQTDQIVMAGALSLTDIRFRYAAFLTDFSDPSLNPTQTIQILRGQDALASYIAAEVANARGDLDGKSFEAAGQMAAQQIMTKMNG